MEDKHYFIILGLVVLLLTLTALTKADATSVSACQNLASPGTYTLTQNISFGSLYCMNVTSHSVLFDGGFYWLNGSNLTDQNAIYANDVINLTVLNTNIENVGASSDGGSQGCAFVYPYTGENYVPDFAISDFAVHQLWEYPSYGLLPHLVKQGDTYHMGVWELVPEDQYIDSLQLQKITSAKGTYAVPEQNGTIHIIGKKHYPTYALDDYGTDYLKQVTAQDNLYWVSDLSKINISSPPMSDGLNLHFDHVTPGKVKLVIRGKDSGLLFFAWKQIETLLDGERQQGYIVLNEDPEILQEATDWAMANGLVTFLVESHGEYIPWTQMMFGNSVFYHTYSTELDAETDTLDIRIDATIYTFMVDEVYIDDTTPDKYTIQYLKPTSIGDEQDLRYGKRFTEKSLEIGTEKQQNQSIIKKILYDDGDYFMLPSGGWFLLNFKDPDLSPSSGSTTLLMRAKAYSETYSFDNNPHPYGQNMTLARMIFNTTGLDRELMVGYFADHYSLVTGIPNETKIGGGHSGLHIDNVTNGYIENISVINTKWPIYQDGIYLHVSTNLTLNNLNLYNFKCPSGKVNCGYGVNAVGIMNSTISNIVINNTQDAMQLSYTTLPYNSSNIIVNNLSIWNCTEGSGGCLTLNGGILLTEPRGYLKNGIINGSEISVYFPLGSSNFKLIDFTLQSELNVTSSSGSNNTLLNCTYEDNREYCVICSQYRKWYYQAYVNDSDGTPIQNANITAYNVSGVLQWESLLTDATGYTPTWEITEYFLNWTERTDHNNYTLQMISTEYEQNHTANVTLQHNIFDIYSQLSVNITNPLDGETYYTATINLNATVNGSQTCQYKIGTGAWNNYNCISQQVTFPDGENTVTVSAQNPYIILYDSVTFTVDTSKGGGGQYKTYLPFIMLFPLILALSEEIKKQRIIG